MTPNERFSHEQFDQRLLEFDAAWHRGETPDIEQYLPPPDAPTDAGCGRRELLVELIMIDMECRWKQAADGSSSPTTDFQGDSDVEPLPDCPQLDDYVRWFPELGAPSDLPVALIADEYRVRQRWGDQPGREAYLQRFPALAAQLNEAIDSIDQRGAAARYQRGLHIRCPHCQNAIELLDETPLSEVACPSCGSSFSLVGDATTSFRPGEPQTIGHFEVLDTIGAGAFGTVCKAHDTELDRTVAIKIPRVGQLDADSTEQFLREARAAAQLRHPNIVAVHEVGRDGSTVFIVSDLVEGVTLADWLTAHKMSPREAAEFCAKVADALHHAHEAGVIHRDLKPSNIMLDAAGEPHIMDFGLAKREAGEITMTVDGRVLGTPAYMSPEQARGQAHDADARSDVYSLGVILFQLLTGELPFKGNARMLVQQVINDDAPRPRRVNKRVPRDLETICSKCLEKQPSRRYPSAKELSEELRRFLGGEQILARPLPRIVRVSRWCRRRPLVSALSAAIVLLLVASTCTVIAVLSRRHLLPEVDIVTVQDPLLLRNCGGAGSRGVAWSPDGGTIAFAHGTDHLISLIEQRTAETILALDGHTAVLKALAWSPDSTRLASGGYDADIRLWNVHTGAVAGTLSGHADRIYSLAWSPDGRHLASASADGTIKIWNPTTGRIVFTLKGHNDIVRHVAWKPDGQRLASASFDGTIRVWDAPSGHLLSTFDSEADELTAVAWSQDGSRLAFGGKDCMLHILDPSTGHVRARFPGPIVPIDHIQWSPVDTNVVAATFFNHGVYVWDLSASQRVRVLRHGTGNSGGIAWSPDGHRLATKWGHASDGYGYIRTWDVWGQQQAAPVKWWVIGPFPFALDAPYGPEKQLDPTACFKGMLGTPMEWKSISTRANGSAIVFDSHIGRQAYTCSAYAMTYVYTPKAQDAAVLLGSDDGVRFWLNESLIYEYDRTSRCRPGQHHVPVTLRAGWNSLLAKVNNRGGGSRVSVAIAGADDLKYATESQDDRELTATSRSLTLRRRLPWCDMVCSGADIVRSGSEWKYLDNGSNLGTRWRQPDFDDSHWKLGRGPLGYGDGDEETVVQYGRDSRNKHTTTYFRRAFDVSSHVNLREVVLACFRDDGVAVYINGTEVVRDNLRNNAEYDVTAIRTDGEEQWSSRVVACPIPPGVIIEGTNVIAAEVHQASRDSSDMGFDLVVTTKCDVDQLVDVLGSGTSAERRRAAWLGGRMVSSSSDLISAMLAATNDAYPDVRTEAVRSLGMMAVSDERVGSTLVDVIAGGGPVASVAEDALTSWASNTGDLLKLLSCQLREGEPVVKTAMCRMAARTDLDLGELDPVLTRLLNHDDSELRQWAAMALARSLPEAVERLDLLSAIDPVRDSVYGPWQLEDACLVVPEAERTTLEIPLCPPPEYTLTVVVEPEPYSRGFVIGLVSAGRRFDVNVDHGGVSSGVVGVDGVLFGGAVPTHRGRQLAGGKPTAIVCEVREDRVHVSCGDTTIVDVRGDLSRMTSSSKWGVTNKARLFLAASNSNYRIHKIELRSVPGGDEGVMPTDPADDAPEVAEPVPTQ